MFRTIAKSNFGTILKNISLAAVLVLGLAQTAKADESKIDRTLTVSCNPFVADLQEDGCQDNLAVNESELVAQRGGGRRRKSKVEGYYAGATLGIFLPSDVDDIETNSGFGGSVFGGVKITENFGGDIELVGFTGDYENIGDVEIDYTGFGIYLNPRAEISVFEIANASVNLFLSPGIGISSTTTSLDFGDAPVNIEGLGPAEELDGTQIGFSFQVKGGVQVPINNSLQIVGQARFATLPTDDALTEDSFNVVSGEAGVNFRF